MAGVKMAPKNVAAFPLITERVAHGISVAKACREAGVKPSSYTSFVKRQKEREAHAKAWDYIAKVKRGEL